MPHHLHPSWRLPKSEHPRFTIHALQLMNLLQDSAVKGRHPFRNAAFWKSCHICAVLLKICQAVQHLGGRHFVFQLLLFSVILLHSFFIVCHPAPPQKGWVDGALSVTVIQVWSKTHLTPFQLKAALKIQTPNYFLIDYNLEEELQIAN